MEEFEYEDDWDEEEDDDEEEGWGLSAEEIAKRLQQVNQEQDKRQEKKEEQKQKKRGRKKGTKNKTRKEKKKRDPNAPPKSKRSKRQGLKLLLIRDYLYNEASEDTPKSTEAIMDYLKENYDIEATDRTIHTDVKRLREDANVPIIYNRHRRGYYIAERQFSNAELRLLVECIYNADFISRSDADFLTSKILGLASRPDREALADKQDEDKKSQTDISVMENIEIINRAIEQKRKIKFIPMQYVAQRTTHTARYNFTHTVSPNKLTWKLGRCILEATLHNNHGANININYDVAFMSDIKILSVPSAYSKPDRTEMPTMAEALDLTYGEKRAITIRFNNEVLDEVVRELGEEAVLIPVDDNHFETTVKVRVARWRTRVNRSFLSWLSSFGCAAKILAPQDIVDFYLDWRKDENEHIQALYEHDKENQMDIHNIFHSKLAQSDDEQFVRYVFDIY